MRDKKYPNEIVMLSHMAALCKFKNCNDANVCLETINQFSDTIGMTAEIDQRGSRFVRVITDWGETIPELWEAIDDWDDIEKIGRMYRKKLDKEEKRIVEEDTGNLIVTFNGDTVRHKLDLFGRRTEIKVRPFIASVKQCFKCFRFGHIKSVCKSEWKDVLFAVNYHTDNAISRNCGGNHRSTYRACKVYEMNRSINVTRREAERILAGKEKEEDQIYDRYEKPVEWPKLRSPRRGMEGKDTMAPEVRKIITRT